LTQLLHGKAPLASSVHDKRGWGHHSGSYTAAKGYRSFQALQYAAPNPAQWNFIWSYPFVPKIDFFCWTLAHRSILTGDNLKTRGMEGPSRCPLCLNEEESSIHLLLECSFSKETWQKVLLLSSGDIAIPENFKELFSSWASLSPFALNKKALLKSAWMWIPKAVCWKIWLERNRRIFREEECSSSRVASKAIAMLGEDLDANPSLVNSRPLDPQEIRWLSGFTSKALTKSAPPKPCLSKWEVRLDE